MRRAEYIQEISELLAIWSSKIKIDNAQGLYDINILSEKVLAKLLSILYDLELENYNSAGRDKGVDIVDNKNKVAYQVTTNLSSSKIKHTLSRFYQSGLEKEYPNGIRFFILQEDTNRILKSNFKEIAPHFNKKTDIISFSDLLKELNLRSLDTVEKFRDELKNQLGLLPKDKSPKASSSKEGIIQQLKNCEKGKESWQEYEDICIEIIKITFEKSFRNFDVRIQQRNENGIDIKDAVIPNRSEIALWRDLRMDYGAKNIIFEFKNYTDKIGKSQLLQVSNYLKKKVYGRFAIIFSREGLSNNGEEEQKELLIHDDKMIIVLNDSKLIQLFTSVNPEYILEDLITDLEMKI